jgi:hypothetical protein
VRRILFVLTASLVMAALLMASALPALAQGPPNPPNPPGAQVAITKALDPNPVIGVSGPCLTLDAPSEERTDIGHHSDFCLA